MSTSAGTTSSLPPAPRGRRSAVQNTIEKIIELFLALCGLLSIGITVLIACLVIGGTYRFFTDPDVSVWYFFTGTQWTAMFSNPKYGILPLFLGTMMVAIIASLVAVPIGLTTAIYLSEYASPKVRNVVKPTLELLAGIPTVIYGYFAIQIVTPFLADVLQIPGLGNPYNQISGGIVVGIMILPIVASLSEDALRSVPRSLREGSYALGATQFETSVRVIVPAALSGIFASFILGFSRAIGETMAVSLACGDKAEFTLDPRHGIATMTSFIVRVSLGDVEHGTTDHHSLFAVAAVLFFSTLSLNVFAQWIVRRYRQVYQ